MYTEDNCPIFIFCTLGTNGLTENNLIKNDAPNRKIQNEYKILQEPVPHSQNRFSKIPFFARNFEIWNSRTRRPLNEREREGLQTSRSHIFRLFQTRPFFCGVHKGSWPQHTKIFLSSVLLYCRV